MATGSVGSCNFHMYFYKTRATCEIPFFRRLQLGLTANCRLVVSNRCVYDKYPWQLKGALSWLFQHTESCAHQTQQYERFGLESRILCRIRGPLQKVERFGRSSGLLVTVGFITSEASLYWGSRYIFLKFHVIGARYFGIFVMSRLKNKEDNSLNQVLALEVFFVCVSLYFSTHFWVRFFDQNASYFGIRYIERLFLTKFVISQLQHISNCTSQQSF